MEPLPDPKTRTKKFKNRKNPGKSENLIFFILPLFAAFLPLFAAFSRIRKAVQRILKNLCSVTLHSAALHCALLVYVNAYAQIPHLPGINEIYRELKITKIREYPKIRFLLFVLLGPPYLDPICTLKQRYASVNLCLSMHVVEWSRLRCSWVQRHRAQILWPTSSKPCGK